MKNADKPAYPYKGNHAVREPHIYNKGLTNEFVGEKIASSVHVDSTGLTKREVFVKEAMAAMIIATMKQKESTWSRVAHLFGFNSLRVTNHYNSKDIAHSAITVADETLNLLES